MIATKRTQLPFLGTHVANIALNKQIGLVFLMQSAQRTVGLSDVSEESLRGDQLAVGAWMIESFLSFSASNDSDAVETQPWIEFEPFDLTCGVEGLMNMDRGEIERHIQIVEQIDAERSTLGDQLWNPEHESSVNFLRRIVVQVSECVTYTTKRVEAIKMCVQMDSRSPATMLRSLTSRGLEMGADLLSGFAGMLGAAGVGPIGYLTLKNMTTPPMVFSGRFLKVVRQAIEKKAVQEGYTKSVKE